MERIEEIVVVGLRRRDRSATVSPVPVDIITAEGGFFFRNPHTGGGVSRGDGGTVKVADLSADGVSGNCPTIPVVDNVADAGAIAAVASNPDCFSFIERFPGGFTRNSVAT